jgi:hypothetical protein
MRLFLFDLNINNVQVYRFFDEKQNESGKSLKCPKFYPPSSLKGGSSSDMNKTLKTRTNPLGGAGGQKKAETKFFREAGGQVRKENSVAEGCPELKLF